MQPSRVNHWRIKDRITPEVDQALQAYPPFLRQILFNREITNAENAAQYLGLKPVDCTNPYKIKDMQLAVKRILDAIDSSEKIAVYGDYDVDGVTATVLLVQVLRKMGASVLEYIPNRFEEGYGLNHDALKTLFEAGIKLVITVDCGIRSLPEVELARSLPLDLIITDHHHPLQIIPKAVAVVNPRQLGDEYPDKELAGVGIAYKLAQALLMVRPIQGVHPEDWLDLVALGTVADLAALVGENRCLVRDGLQKIRQGRRQGLVSLAMAAGLSLEKITAGDISFILAPRLNAAGRLEDARDAFGLLVTDDLHLAGKLAQRLDDQNRQRQKITRDIQEKVEQRILSAQQDTFLIFAEDPEFNPGVVGLAASRLAELYYRPAIVAHHSGEFTRGSCRSITGFHITEALDQCADLLERHGGHAAAAGFTVRSDRFQELMERLQAIAMQQLGDLTQLTRVLVADLELSLSDIHYGMLTDLEKTQPTGNSNPEAVFVSRDLMVTSAKQVGKDFNHLKLVVRDSKGVSFNAIAFRQGYRYADLPPRIDLMYTLENNEYKGFSSLQLNVRDLKASGISD